MIRHNINSLFCLLEFQILFLKSRSYLICKLLHNFVRNRSQSQKIYSSLCFLQLYFRWSSFSPEFDLSFLTLILDLPTLDYSSYYEVIFLLKTIIFVQAFFTLCSTLMAILFHICYAHLSSWTQKYLDRKQTHQ